MIKQILFVHGVGEGTYEEDRLLVDNLRAELGEGYQVNYPPMPDADKPTFAGWSGQIAAELAKLEGPVVLVGHSLGGSVVLKYLAEQTPPVAIAGVFAVAAPFWGEPEWEVSDFELAQDFAAHLPSGLPIFLYQGTDDEIVTLNHVARYQTNLPQATVRKVAGFDHQFNNDLSAVARDIEKL